MLTKQRKRDDNDDGFDANGVLRDRHRYHVPMKMMDAADLPKVGDADGGSLAQPGFTCRDDATDATALVRQVLYDTYDKEISEQWKNQPGGVTSHRFVGARVGDLCTVRSGGGSFGLGGAAGHLRSIDDKLVVLMSAMDAQQREVSQHANHLHDGTGNRRLINHQPGFIVSDAVTAEERQRVRDAHDEYEREVTTAWKGGAT